MAKLILSIDGTVLREFVLVRERTSIGRRPYNDIQIDNLAISGEHALVVRSGDDIFLEDLDSTNGTVVNGEAIKKHVLADGDVIGLGKYRLKFFAELPVPPVREDSAQRDAAAPAPAEGAPVPVPPGMDTIEASPLPLAELRIVSGANAGQLFELSKARSLIGKSGAQAAAIARRPDGYFISHFSGEPPALLNGRSLAEAPAALADQDVIEVAGVKMAFVLKNG